MEIKKLHHHEVSDFRNLIEIFKEVFDNHSQTLDNNDLSSLLSNNDFMVFVVKSENKVVGGLTIYVLHSYYNEKPIAYIYDVGILPNFQGQGLGKTLISEVCKFCKQNNFEEAYVEAEGDDIDAIGFYRKTKMSHEMNAIHFTYTFEDES